MKKALAILLAALMVFSLFACGSSSSGAQNSTNSVQDTEDVGIGESLAAGNAGGKATDFSAEKYFGFFDDTYDYSADDSYSVAYVVVATNILYEAFSQAFELWAGRYNCTYQFVTCSGDSDLFLSSLQTLADQGVQGFLLDPDSQTFPRVTEVCQELVGDAWMSCMSYPYDANNKMNHPFVGFDNYNLGVQEVDYLVNYAKENWEGFDASKAAMVACDFSISVQIHERNVGAQDHWNELYPAQASNFYMLDLINGTMVEEDSYNELSALMALHPEVEYWLVIGTLDTYALGATRAAEEYGVADNTAITAIGGTALVNDWDAGNETCWRSAIFSAQLLYAEPIFGAMYYMMRGWCTAKDIWQDYTNKDSNNYGWLYLACFTIEKDTYQDYLEWVDWHSGFDYYKYAEYNPTTGGAYDLILPVE